MAPSLPTCASEKKDSRRRPSALACLPPSPIIPFYLGWHTGGQGRSVRREGVWEVGVVAAVGGRSGARSAACAPASGTASNVPQAHPLQQVGFSGFHRG